MEITDKKDRMYKVFFRFKFFNLEIVKINIKINNIGKILFTLVKETLFRIFNGPIKKLSIKVVAKIICKPITKLIK